MKSSKFFQPDLRKTLVMKHWLTELSSSLAITYHTVSALCKLTAGGCVHPYQTDRNVIKNEEFKKQKLQNRTDFTKKRQEASYDKT